MYDASRYLLFAVLAVPALLAAYFALVFVLALGPVGLFVAIFVGLAVMATGTWLRDDGTGSQPAERTNCPACGAPNPAEAEACGYCDASLDDAKPRTPKDTGS